MVADKYSGNRKRMDFDPARRGSHLLFETRIPDTALGPRDARHAAIRALPWDSNIDTAELVISELVANAVLHAGSPCVLGIYGWGPCLLIQVQDTSDDQPVPGPPLPSNGGVSGRGLQIVHAVTESFGVQPVRPTGKIVWATVCLCEGEECGQDYDSWATSNLN